ncbi:hypothetical protein ACFH04_07765 [Streptomyces noboritoensis]|uniref:MacB-like periplasmic core domain-containing protein n=1 Tax=Streptomyces noboritoensis TaxID=67337 RepID=A0ABV6TCW4_9ACTN
MIISWVSGLLRHRTGRLAATAAGIALAVALVAALGSFLTASKSTMTARAVRSVAVAWQAEVQSGADPHTVLAMVRATDGVRGAEPVGFARSTGFQATEAGSTQSTGPGVVLGLPDTYRQTFPGAVRPLTGTATGVLLAQQTAANLHVVPGTPSPSACPAPHRPMSPSRGSSISRRPTPCSRRSVPRPRPSPPPRPTTSSSCRKPSSPA